MSKNLIRETKFSRTNGHRGIAFPSCSTTSITTSRFGNHTRLMANVLKVMTTHNTTVNSPVL